MILLLGCLAFHYLVFFNFCAVHVLAQLSSCVEIRRNEQFPTFDIVLAQNLSDDRNRGVSVANVADKLFRLASDVERSQEMNVSIAVAVIETISSGDMNGMWQYKNSIDEAWTTFPDDLSDSNALLITRAGFIRFAPNADYFNVPEVGRPPPKLNLHGWNGIDSNNNISAAAIKNCVFSVLPGTALASVIQNNYVGAVEITSFSMKLVANIQLTHSITDGVIYFKAIPIDNTCEARSVTRKVEDAVSSAIGGVFEHEIHLLLPFTIYIPSVVIPAAEINIEDLREVITAPDVVKNVEVKEMADSSSFNISWESDQMGLLYGIIINGREGPFGRERQSDLLFQQAGIEGFATDDTNITITGLKSNTGYEIRVIAVDQSFDFLSRPVSLFSLPVLFQTNVTQIPGPPRYVKLYQACCLSAVVQWEFPTEPEGPIIDFNVQLFNNEEPSFPRFSFVADVSERSHIFTSVPRGDFYATVQARNSKGLGQNATSSVITMTPSVDFTTTVLVANVTESSAVVRIVLVDRPPTTFTILLYPNNDCRNGNPNDGTNIASQYRASGLQPFTAYSVCVWEPGQPLNTSIIHFFITNQSVPTGRAGIQDVSHLMPAIARVNSVLLRWTPVDGPNGVIGYEVIVEELEDLGVKKSLFLDPNQLPPLGQDESHYQWRVTDLEAGVGYKFTVRPFNLFYNLIGEGTSIVVFTFVGRPGPPTNPQFADATTMSLTVSWNPPEKKNGKILSYGITLVMDDGNSSDGCQPNSEQHFASVSPQLGDRLEYTFTGLMPNTSYSTAIRARTAAGYGSVSFPISNMTLPLTPTLLPVPNENGTSTTLDYQTPTPVGPCLGCGDFGVCVPQNFGCSCDEGFIGNGSICVENPRAIVEPQSESEILVLFRRLRNGDLHRLVNVTVDFQLLTPDNQLVQHSQSQFQLYPGDGLWLLELTPVVFSGLWPGMYMLNYSFPIGSIVYTQSLKAETKFSVPEAPPTSITIVMVTNISATVSWRPPHPVFNNGPLTGFDVIVNSLFTANGLFISLRRQTTHNVTLVKIEGLRPFQKYEVKVAARTSAGRGPWSKRKCFTTESAIPGPPRIDDAFYVFNGSSKIVYMSWQYPAVPQGNITYFLIEIDAFELFSETEVSENSTVGAKENDFLLEKFNRPQNEVEIFRVKIQAGTDSLLGRPAAQDILFLERRFDLFLDFANVIGITETESGNFSANVSWPAVNQTELGISPMDNAQYWISSTKGSRSCEPLPPEVEIIFRININESTTSVVLPNLLSSSVYSVCVLIAHGRESFHLLARTFVRTPQSVPGPVKFLSSQSISSNSTDTRLTWLPPSFPNGVIGYKVQVKEISGNHQLSFSIQPSSLITSDENETVGLLLSGLNGNRKYNLSVMAYNLKSGRNGKSESVELKTNLGIPRPPKNVTITSEGSNSITVHWLPSVSDDVVEYEITTVLANTTEDKLPQYIISPHVEVETAAQSKPTVQMKRTISGLKPFTKYVSWVKAINSAGESQPSDVAFQETKPALIISTCTGLTCIFSEVTAINFQEFIVEVGEDILNRTSQQIIRNDSLQSDEIETVIGILEALVDLQEKALSLGIPLMPSDRYINSFIEVSSILLDLQQEDSWLALNLTTGAPVFLSSLERYGRVIAASYSFSNELRPMTFSSDNLVLAVNSITDSNVNAVVFPNDSLPLTFSSLSEGQMTISSSLLLQLLQKPNVTQLFVSNMVFQNLQQYMPYNNTSTSSRIGESVGEQRNSSDQAPSTVLVSGSIVEDIVGQPYNPSYTTRMLPANVTIAYGNIEPDSIAKYTCAYWQFKTNSTPGQWVSSGVTTIQINDTSILCLSNHLTSFSVLVSIGSAESSDTLTYITFIGCGISLLALLITLIVLIAFRSYLLFERNFININFVIALMLALIFFMAGIDQSSNRDACKAMTVLLHYFFLAVFCWMLCEAYLLYLLLVVVFDSGKTYANRYFAFGWGLPVLIVGISFGIRYDEYGKYDYCFLTHHEGLIWAFVGPMAAILLVNLVVFIKAVKVVVSKANTSSNKFRVAKTGLKAMGVFLPVLGLTWGIGVFAVDTLSLPLAYAFTILNSLQGLFVFIFHCLLNIQIHKAIKSIRQKQEQLKLAERSIGTSNTGIGTASKSSKARAKKSNKYEVAAATDKDTVEMQSVELHQFRNDTDKLESSDPQMTSLKAETFIGNANSMASVRSDEPLKERSDSSQSADSSPESSPKSGQIRDNDDLQEEQPFERDESSQVQEVQQSQTFFVPLSPDPQPVGKALPLVTSLSGNDSVSSIDTLQSIPAASCMVIPREAGHAVIVQQGNDNSLGGARSTDQGSRDRYPSTTSDSNSAGIGHEKFI